MVSRASTSGWSSGVRSPRLRSLSPRVCTDCLLYTSRGRKSDPTSLYAVLLLVAPEAAGGRPPATVCGSSNTFAGASIEVPLLLLLDLLPGLIALIVGFL